MAAQKYYPTPSERMWNIPSRRLYDGFCNLMTLQYHDNGQWLQPLPNEHWHNHYFIVLRECSSKHNDAEDCTEFLYPACSHLCSEHRLSPIASKRLDDFLKGFFG